jgi:hypothetical protein
MLDPLHVSLDDPGHDRAQFVSFRRVQVGFLVFGEKRYGEYRDVRVVVVLDHAIPATLARTFPGETDLADAAGPLHNDTRCGVLRQEVDQVPVFVLIQARLLHIFEERGRFDDRQQLCHGLT